MKSQIAPSTTINGSSQLYNDQIIEREEEEERNNSMVTSPRKKKTTSTDKKVKKKVNKEKPQLTAEQAKE